LIKSMKLGLKKNHVPPFVGDPIIFVDGRQPH